MTSDKADFTQGNILKKLVAFMMPILGALILQAAYGAVDLLVVGRFGSTSGLSAVSTGSQVLNLVTFVVIQFAMGITVLIARYLGEKRPERIGAVIGGGAVVFTMMSVALFIAMVGFARPISVLMQAPAEAVDLTASYVRICGAGILFIVAYNLLSAIFRGLGDSKSPLLFVLVACIVNIIGDLILVAGLHMDAAGAAIATVTAQALSVVFAVMLLLKKDLPFAITKKDFRLNPQCRKFLKIGLPLALQEFLTQISFLALCAFVNRLGLEASSGYGVACKIVNFAMLVPSSLMQSMASFVSQNIGAGKKKRAKQSMFTGIGVGLAVGCVVFVLVLFKGCLLYTSVLELDNKKMKINEWPRHGIQALWALLTNSHLSGFVTGKIYTGKLKNVCVPGLNCYSCPGATGACPIGSLQAVIGSWNFKMAYYVVGFLIFVGALLGRLVCGFLCPFGLIQDLLNKIPFPKKIRTFRGDKLLRKLKYVIFLIFVILLPMFVVDIMGQGAPYFCKLICPAGTLEGGLPLVLLNKSMRSAVGWLYIWKNVILVIMIILAILIYRPFCKYICPLGAFYSIFNKVSVFRYRVDEEKCIHCGKCAKACQMEVNPVENPNSAECIRCGRCKKACPTQAIQCGVKR